MRKDKKRQVGEDEADEAVAEMFKNLIDKV